MTRNVRSDSTTVSGAAVVAGGGTGVVAVAVLAVVAVEAGNEPEGSTTETGVRRAGAWVVGGAVSTGPIVRGAKPL